MGEPLSLTAKQPVGPISAAGSCQVESVREPGPWLAANRPDMHLPDYLLRHYWWAYIWRPAVWLLDRQWLINLIVFGQYKKLVDATLAALTPSADGRNILIASAYGSLLPQLARRLGGQELTVIDIAPVQLERAGRKLENARLDSQPRLTRMDAERLHFAADSHTRALMFLLLHELPVDARRRALEEACRVVQVGGELVLTDYNELTRTHWFHRLAPLRWVFGKWEPFLPSLWQADLDALVDDCARAAGKRALPELRQQLFGGFYRSLRYRITAR